MTHVGGSGRRSLTMRRGIASRPGSRKLIMTETIATLTRSAEQTRPQRGLWSDAWRRLRRNKAALLGLLIVLLMGVIAIFAGSLAPYPYDEQHVDSIFQPVGAPGFPLGTDQLGRDMLS